MNLQHCQFCYALHTPRPHRVPSQTCDRCWLEIQAGLSQPSPDFSDENCRRITFIPEVFYEN